MVSDMGEFSIRGDISDVYGLSKNPIRIEFWGDEIVDIRYFNNETQKSIEKIQNVEIYPLYKFIIEDNDCLNFDKDLDIQLKDYIHVFLIRCR